jgi:2-polyprenyl-6-hydroxyphenyl methylase/3-demethylubiquinone-9 3-methyltransferase
MVAGVDSSPAGCALARARLAEAGVAGTIHQLDVTAAGSTGLGRFDLVCSFGVVEHFTDLGRILPSIARLVAPGGMLVTTVPNLKSIHGGLMAWWQPEVFAAHRITTAAMLTSAYARLGFTGIACRPLGICSLDIVAWEVAPRWPRLAKAVAPLMRRVIGLSDRLFIATRIYRGTPRLAPFLAASGIGPG